VGETGVTVSFVHRDAPAQLVEEIFEKDHLALRLLRFRRIGGHEHSDTFAVRGQIIVRYARTYVRNPLRGPHLGTVRNERIPFCREVRHHDLVILRSEEEIAPIARPRRRHAAIVRDLPSAPPVWKRSYVHLEAAGLIRCIGQPSAVRRKDRVALVERGLRKTSGLPARRPEPSISRGTVQMSNPVPRFAL